MLQLDGTLHQSWQWGELRRYHGWIPWRVLVEEQGTVRAATQILERRVGALPMCVLYAPRGIVYQGIDHRALRELVEWLRRFMRKRHAVFLRTDPEIRNSDDEGKKTLTTAGFRALCEKGSMWNLPRASMVLDISPSSEKLLSGMRRTHRQLIYRAANRGVIFDCGTDVRHVRDFYDLLLKTSRRQGFPVREFEYFLEIRRTLLANGQGMVFLAIQEQRIVAGAVCARFGRRCHYLYGGFDWEFRRAEANEALQWRAIRWAKDGGCHWYDTGGTGTSYPPREGNPGYGVYNYKKGFGADICYSAGLFDLVNSQTVYAAFRLFERNLLPRAHKLAGGLVSWARRFRALWLSVKINKQFEKPA